MELKISLRKLVLALGALSTLEEVHQVLFSNDDQKYEANPYHIRKTLLL